MQIITDMEEKEEKEKRLNKKKKKQEEYQVASRKELWRHGA